VRRGALVRVLGTAIPLSLLTWTATQLAAGLQRERGWAPLPSLGDALPWWIGQYAEDPGKMLGYAGLVPHWVHGWTPLLLPLGAVAGLVLAIRGGRPAATRVFGGAWALAGLLLGTWLLLEAAEVDAGAVPPLAVPLVDVLGRAFLALLLLRPLRRAGGARTPLADALPALALVVALQGLDQSFSGSVLQAGADTIGGPFGGAHGQWRAFTGPRGGGKWLGWARAAAVLLLIPVPPLLVLRGTGLAGAARILLRAARRRPLALLGSSLGLFAGLHVVLTVLAVTSFWSLSVGPDLHYVLIVVTGGVVAGLLTGFWIWLQATAALFLADAGTAPRSRA